MIVLLCTSDVDLTMTYLILPVIFEDYLRKVLIAFDLQYYSNSPLFGMAPGGNLNGRPGLPGETASGAAGRARAGSGASLGWWRGRACLAARGKSRSGDARRTDGHGRLPTRYGRIQRPARRGLPAQTLCTDRSAGECALCRRKKVTKGAVEPGSCAALLGALHRMTTRGASCQPQPIPYSP